MLLYEAPAGKWFMKTNIESISTAIESISTAIGKASRGIREKTGNIPVLRHLTV